MINHLEHMTLAHIKDLVSGKQRHISDFVELDKGDVALSAKRVHNALARHRKRMDGGEKI